MTQEEIARVLRVWYLIEMMSPQTVRFEDRKKEEPSHIAVRPNEEIRWEALGKRQQTLFQPLLIAEAEDPKDADAIIKKPKPKATFIAYLGLSRVTRFDEAIAEAAQLTLTDLDKEQAGKDRCAWASIQLAKNGAYIPESLVISTVPWALKELRRLGLKGFVDSPDAKAFESFCEPLDSELPFEPEQPVTPQSLFSAADMIRRACRLEKVVEFDERAHISIFDYPTKEHQDLLNSFYYEDIADAMAANTREKLPPLVSQMFSRLSDSDRSEVLRTPENLRRLFSQGHSSSAAWPSTRLKPILMQEAVVEATHLLNDSSRIVAVNGPPGTGKTTLLRSFVADQVIERARAIADCSTKPTKIHGPGDGYYCLPKSITGFEIVVASANNGAIENISKELPELDGVAGFEDLLAADRGYYQTVAQFIGDFANANKGSKKWGLVAASLGNKDKRQAFIEPFWFTNPKEKHHPDLDNFKTFQQQPSEFTFSQARDEFRASLERVAVSLSGLRDDGFWGSISEDKHARSPKHSDELLLAKREAFVYALRLHRAYVKEHWRAIYHNLRKWIDVLRKGSTFHADEATAIWQTFFLIVPVVSTTFASARRMLPTVENLGWAVIDEAGQAAPQAALGLFARTKKAIVVGDPLQLEPVVTLSGAIVRGFREALEVDQTWTAANDTGASLQTVVEQTTPWGTYRPIGREEKWFGIPLVVHRRCVEPMFSIVNKVVYNNDMINHTDSEYDYALYPFGESCWIDDTSAITGVHTVLPQIDVVLDAIFAMRSWYSTEWVRLHREYAHLPERLEDLRKRWEQPDIKVITPFRETEHRFHERYRERFLIEAQRLRLPQKRRLELLPWAEQHAGTVHKAQGKEAGMVFCILGLQASKPGAAEFATAKPNFMNVAVSRAKHRLYMVGDADLWGSMPYFHEVYTALGENRIITPDSFAARFGETTTQSLLGDLPQALPPESAAS